MQPQKRKKKLEKRRIAEKKSAIVLTLDNREHFLAKMLKSRQLILSRNELLSISGCLGIIEDDCADFFNQRTDEDYHKKCKLIKATHKQTQTLTNKIDVDIKYEDGSQDDFTYDNIDDNDAIGGELSDPTLPCQEENYDVVPLSFLEFMLIINQVSSSFTYKRTHKRHLKKELDKKFYEMLVKLHKKLGLFSDYLDYKRIALSDVPFLEIRFYHYAYKQEQDDKEEGDLESQEDVMPNKE